MSNPTFAKEDSREGTLDLETPPHTHTHTHYGYVVFRIDHDLTLSNTSFTLTILLCIRYYRHAKVVAYTGL